MAHPGRGWGGSDRAGRGWAGREWALGVLGGLAALLFPPRCAGCHRPGPVGLCADCLRGLAGIAVPLCGRCGVPVLDGGAAGSRLCHRCLRHPPPFRTVRALGLFQGHLRRAVHRFKFAAAVDVGRALGRQLGEVLAREGMIPARAVLVPVPAHPDALRGRGYHPAAILARAVAEVLRLPLQEEALRRIRAGPPQRGLGYADRVRNVRHAFAATPLASSVVRRPIWLVDDVMTSGATAAACAELLLAAGAASVSVAVVARAVLPPTATSGGGAAGAPPRTGPRGPPG